jgi:glycosyltransferase involved in cell wall biosynthesis
MSETHPTVSVLMPVYNSQRYVAAAVESILGQTFADFEFLIVDDGSTDKSRMILESYAARDDRIKLVSRPNTGYLIALNEMLVDARASLLARMDADDLAEPGRLSRQVDYLRAHPDCLAVGTAILAIDPDGDPLGVWNDQILSHEQIEAVHLGAEPRGAIAHPSVLMRADAVRAVGGYRAEYYMVEDLDLWLRLGERGVLANLAEPLLRYRQHPSSICHNNGGRQRVLSRRVADEARRRRGLPPLEAREPAASAAGAAIDPNEAWGWQALGSGHTATARKHAWAYFARRPLSPPSWRLLYCALRGH